MTTSYKLKSETIINVLAVISVGVVAGSMIVSGFPFIAIAMCIVFFYVTFVR